MFQACGNVGVSLAAGLQCCLCLLGVHRAFLGDSWGAQGITFQWDGWTAGVSLGNLVVFQYFVPLSVQISLRKELLYEICLKYSFLLVDNSCDSSAFL